MGQVKVLKFVYFLKYGHVCANFANASTCQIFPIPSNTCILPQKTFFHFLWLLAKLANWFLRVLAKVYTFAKTQNHKFSKCGKFGECKCKCKFYMIFASMLNQNYNERRNIMKVVIKGFSLAILIFHWASLTTY